MKSFWFLGAAIVAVAASPAQAEEAVAPQTPALHVDLSFDTAYLNDGIGAFDMRLSDKPGMTLDATFDLTPHLYIEAMGRGSFDSDRSYGELEGDVYFGVRELPTGIEGVTAEGYIGRQCYGEGLRACDSVGAAQLHLGDAHLSAMTLRGFTNANAYGGSYDLRLAEHIVITPSVAYIDRASGEEDGWNEGLSASYEADHWRLDAVVLHEPGAGVTGGLRFTVHLF